MIANPSGERAWHLASMLCLLVSLPCLIAGLLDEAFIVATLGIVAYFLGLRHRCPAALIEAERTEAAAAERLLAENATTNEHPFSDHRIYETADESTRAIQREQDKKQG